MYAAVVSTMVLCPRASDFHQKFGRASELPSFDGMRHDPCLWALALRPFRQRILRVPPVRGLRAPGLHTRSLGNDASLFAARTAPAADRTPTSACRAER